MRALLVVCLSTIGISPALAQSPTAERLFNEGVALSEQGKFAEACARFEESLARDARQLGAMLQLGRCNREQGKIATAMKYYQAARQQAIEARKVRSRDEAEQHIRELEADVPRLRFVRERDAYPGEKLLLDDNVVSLTEQLTPDPGTHTVTLTAPGRLPYETKLQIAAGERRDVTLPALDVPKNQLTTRERSTRRAVGKTLTIAGLGTAAVTGALAILAKRDYDGLFDSEDPHCGLYPDIGGKVACDDYGVSIADRDSKLVTFGVIGASVGLAVAITGVLLWATAPDETSTTTIVPTVDASGPGVMIQRAIRW